MVYPTDEETFDERVSPEFTRDDHLNLIQSLLKRIQDFLGYGGRLHDETGLVMPVGAIMPYGGLTAPSGWLLCDGKAYLLAHSDYAELYAVIGTKYGAFGGDSFHVPDLRGYFLRGYSKIPTISFVPGSVSIAADSIALSGQKFNRSAFPVRFTTDDTLPAPLVINTTYYLRWAGSETFNICSTRANAIAEVAIDLTTVGVGTSYVAPYLEEDKDSRLKLTVGGNDGEDLGSYQSDEYESHRHLANDCVRTFNGVDNLPSGTTDSRSQRWTQFSGGTETRPRNVNVNYIIKR